MGHIILKCCKNEKQKELILQKLDIQRIFLLYLTSSCHSNPLMHGDIKKSYRLLYWRELLGQGKESCTVCLIERHVVNCLCVGGEKSICFLTAVTSGPLGEKLEQTDTCTNTRTCRALPNPSNHALQVQCHAADQPSLFWHTHLNVHKSTPSWEMGDVHEGLSSQGRVGSIYWLFFAKRRIRNMSPVRQRAISPRVRDNREWNR